MDAILFTSYEWYVINLRKMADGKYCSDAIYLMADEDNGGITKPLLPIASWNHLSDNQIHWIVE